jgi:hypothetical protein
LQLGNGVAAIQGVDYGNLLITMHSGYFHKNPLEGEPLRLFLEGWEKINSDYVLEQLTKIVGSKGTLDINGSVLNIEVLGGVRLEPKEADEVWLNPDKVTDISTKMGENGYLAMGNPEIFENIKNNSHEIIINFCGWGPQSQTTYYRYVILLKVTRS